MCGIASGYLAPTYCQGLPEAHQPSMAPAPHFSPISPVFLCFLLVSAVRANVYDSAPATPVTAAGTARYSAAPAAPLRPGSPPSATGPCVCCYWLLCCCFMPASSVWTRSTEASTCVSPRTAYAVPAISNALLSYAAVAILQHCTDTPK
jgi:hypothetical protein